MAIADASSTTVSYVAEVTAGTTPASPSFKKLRFTGGGLKHIQDFVKSNEIRPDRNVTDQARVARRTEGPFNFELSYGTYDDLIESLMQSTWSTNVIGNGNAKKFFSFEEIFETGATDQYKRSKGVCVNTMNLEISAGQIVTGSFGLMGFGEPSLAQAALSGATYAAPNDNPVLTASNDFASFTSSDITSPKIQAISLSITNNMRNQSVVGSIDPVGVGSGRFEVSGTATMFFENSEAYDLFLANGYTDLAFSLGGATALRYDFSLPKIKFLDADLSAGGNDTDVPVTLQFGAVYDSTDGVTFQITRDPS